MGFSAIGPIGGPLPAFPQTLGGGVELVGTRTITSNLGNGSIELLYKVQGNTLNALRDFPVKEDDAFPITGTPYGNYIVTAFRVDPYIPSPSASPWSVIAVTYEDSLKLARANKEFTTAASTVDVYVDNEGKQIVGGPVPQYKPQTEMTYRWRRIKLERLPPGDISRAIVGKRNSAALEYSGDERKWLCTNVEGVSLTSANVFQFEATFLFDEDEHKTFIAEVDPDTGDLKRDGSGNVSFLEYALPEDVDFRAYLPPI